MDSNASSSEMLEHEEKLLGELSASKEEYLDLIERRRFLEKAESLTSLYGRVLGSISGDEGGMLSAISALKACLLKSGEDVGDLPELLDSADIALREASSRCSSKLSTIEGAPWMIEQIDARLDSYGKLLGRYGGDIDRLLARMTEVSTELGRREAMARELDGLESLRAELSAGLARSASELTGLRTRARKPMEKAVGSELAKLGMPGSTFEVVFSSVPADRSVRSVDLSVCSDGAELPEFMFSANAGLPPGPVSSVASGGELSRLSLAVRLALSGPAGSSTLVFDEIDSGVGGETAGLLASSLSRASRGRQTIVITHLPQIASRAGRHLAVSKSASAEMPVTTVRALEGESRVEEIARMLGGGVAAIEHARAMLSEAGRKK
jgi:DNA repair protein RecN (Recombination protein N)